MQSGEQVDINLCPQFERTNALTFFHGVGLDDASHRRRACNSVLERVDAGSAASRRSLSSASGLVSSLG